MKKTVRKMLAVLLTVAIILSCISVSAAALNDFYSNAMDSSLNTALSYINGLTLNNSSNVPSTVVSRYGTQFTWDNERRESANKNYLFEWSYYNGVVFEGLEYIYDYTEDPSYRDYVEAYMSAMIASNGTWAKTSNNTSKDCAGYVNYHGADCYKTASLLLDMAKNPNGTINTSSKYYIMATSLYNDLTTGAGRNYTKSELGYNYWHSNWNSQTAPTYAVWLDGIYMIQPFMAEYAYYANDTAQMSKILSRFQWLYNNGRNSSTGLYYHAINSASSVCNYHWTRAIGWYAMAVVDVMQYMSGSNLDAMKVILKDLVDNMLPYQSATTGMWANVTNAAVTSTNRLETSGTAMMAYTIAKGVNNGWLDSSYGQYAKAAFVGMVQNKLSGNTLSDIYFKASASGTNNYETTSNYYTNEGKGVGPFIMSYAQVRELYENESSVVDLIDQPTGITVKNTTATAIAVSDITNSLNIFGSRNFVAYDISLSNYNTNEVAEVYIPVPSGIDASNASLYYIDNNNIASIVNAQVVDGNYVFQTNRMGKYAIVEHVGEDSANWVQVGNGYYALTGNVDHSFVIGTAFDINKIAAETFIRYKANELADSTAVSWTDSSVSYTWTPALDMSTTGSYTMNVRINNTSIGTLTVYVGEDDYPIFPNEGSVVIDKWADPDQLRNTGVTEVNLSAKGIPSPKPVDVLFITDVSNSMYWVAGTTTNATANQSSKLNDMQNAVADFTETLFAGNYPGNERNNTISFVTFGGLDKQHEQNTNNVKNWATYADPTRTLFTSAETVSAVTTPVNNIRYTAVDSTVFITFDGSDGSANTSTDVSYGGTNYDYGFMEASSAITQIKQNYYNKTGNVYDNSERSIYVIFITDGAPTHYNGVMYRHDTDTTRPDKNETWINPNGQEVVYVNGYNNGSANYTQAQWYSYLTSTRSHWATQVYNTTKVADMYALGIDMANGGFASWVFTEASGYPLRNFVEKIVTNKTLDTYFADNSTQIADNLLFMASALTTSSSDAYAIDTMGPMVDLQMAQTVNCGIADGGTLSLSDYNIVPSITVKTYDCYSLKEVGTVVNGVTVTTEMVGTHKNENPTINEIVTFNATGTQAYSDKLSGNIMSNGVITASKFIYNSNSTPVTLSDGSVLPGESFKWLVDSIVENETVLSYYVYLTGSMEGERPRGTYDTNESAVLYYNNYLGHDCQLEYPVPQITWDQASVTYQLYLVDQFGNPINSNGHTVPFENRTRVSELVELEKYLNTATVIDYEVLQSRIPEGYMIYNENASYSGKISSNDSLNEAIIDDTTGTTKIFFPTGTDVGPDGVVTGLDDYTNIKVTFAVVKLGINPDAIVVDYGKTITIDPLANDVGDFVINGILTSEAIPGTNTVNSLKLASGVALVEPTPLDQGIEVPAGNLVIAPFTLGGTVYVYPTLGTTSTQNDTSKLRYAVNTNGQVTKYAANSTSSIGLGTLTDGDYLLDGTAYALYRSGNYVSVASGYMETTTETTVQTPVSYYRLTNSTVSVASNKQIASTNRNSRTNMFTLPDNRQISAYRSGTRTYTLYFYDNNTNTEIARMNTNQTSITFQHTVPGAFDNNGNPITVTVTISRTGNNRTYNINANYTGYEQYNDTITETTTVSTLKTKQYYERDKVSYSLFNYISSIETFYYYVSPRSNPVRNSDSSTLEFAKVQVIPATTVYYEDDFGGSAENGGLYIQYTGNWYKVSDDGTNTSQITSNTNTSDRQDDGEIGVGNVPYGYDSSYENCTKFSNGTAMTVEGTVSKVNGQKQYDATAEFTFTGTGFDIISRTDMYCGQIMVTIYDANDNFITNVPVINKGTNTLYQIPVINYTGIPYGTYKVKINVCAPSAILNISSSTFYLDAIRIYNPLGLSGDPGEDGDETAKTAYDAYYADNEANAYVASIRDYILSIGDIRTNETVGAVYVDTIDNDYSGGGLLDKSSIAEFQLVGPNEEVYITPGKGIGFALVCSQKPKSVQLGVKLPVPLNNGADIYVETIDSNGNAIGTPDSITVTSGTEMYYDITKMVEFTPADSDSYGEGEYQKAVVVLMNGIDSTNNDIISITDIKMTYDNDVSNIVELKELPEEPVQEEEEILQTASFASTELVDDGTTVVNGLVASWDIYCNVFDEIYTINAASKPSYNVALASDFKTVAKGLSATATFTSSQYVESLTVTDENGNPVNAEITSALNDSKLISSDFETAKTWTVTVSAGEGKHTYTVAASNGEGDAATAKLMVTPAEVVSLKVVKNPRTTSYVYGDEIDTLGLVLEATYTDGTVRTITSGYTLNKTIAKGIGSQKVTVNYQGVTASFNVKVTFNLAGFIRSLFKFSFFKK